MAATSSSAPAKQDQAKVPEAEDYSLAYRHAFGLKADCDAHFFDEMSIVYVAGHTVVLYQTDQKSQRFLPGGDFSQEISCVAVSANKKFLAVAEKVSARVVAETNLRPIVTIYDLVTCRRRKTCCYLDIDCTEVVALAFDATNKHLLTQYGQSPSGKHDWTLIDWAWDRGKATPIAITKVGPHVVNQVSFNPLDSLTVLCIGESTFKFYKVQESDGCFRSVPYQLAKVRGAQNYFCHTWLQDDRLIVGCGNGEILLFDNAGELTEILSISVFEAVHLLHKRNNFCTSHSSKKYVAGVS